MIDEGAESGNTTGPAPVVALFSGLDPTGGAGIAADIIAVRDTGAYALPFLTANTVQGQNVKARFVPIDPTFLLDQIQAVFPSIQTESVKIGMIGTPAIFHLILNAVTRFFPGIPVVLDPVASASSGGCLVSPASRDAILAAGSQIRLLTPNLLELEWLAGHAIRHSDDLDRALAIVGRHGFQAVLVKGGHGEGDPEDKLFIDRKQVEAWKGRRVPVSPRGTGCRLAAFIAGKLASGDDLIHAVHAAYQYVQCYILGSPFTGCTR
ncbi:hydroxymethylpyrimidine/phosphomethylpyrimidine kinase [bacterium]|nr:hydroxymethylpyrimidine/phosphomethylpyrimidine kinase [candidate division CSSED10-310 bacterium]